MRSAVYFGIEHYLCHSLPATLCHIPFCTDALIVCHIPFLVNVFQVARGVSLQNEPTFSHTVHAIELAGTPLLGSILLG